MKMLISMPAIVMLLLFTSASTHPVAKNMPAAAPGACTWLFRIDNTDGFQTITRAKIEWPGFSREWATSVTGGSTLALSASNAGNDMKYPVKVTLWWESTPATGPKLRLYSTASNVLIGLYNSSPTSSISTAVVNGTNANGPGASYCHGVTVFVTES
jgi:hypothetical protein